MSIGSWRRDAMASSPELVHQRARRYRQLLGVFETDRRGPI